MNNRWFALLFVLTLSTLFCWLSVSVYRIKAISERHFRVTDDFVNHEIRDRWLPDGKYYHSLAGKLQAYSHNPETIVRSYQKAMIKSPADDEIWSAFANYLAVRGCCKEQMIRLLSGVIRIASKKPEAYFSTGWYLIQIGKRSEGFEYIRRGLELNPRSGREIYSDLLEEKGVSFEDLFRLIPKDVDSLILLSHYLMDRANKQDLMTVVQYAVKIPMNDENRLELGRAALRAGIPSLAKQQALKVQGTKLIAARKFQLLADIAWEENDIPHFEEFASLAVHKFKEGNNSAIGGHYAVSTILRLSTVEERSVTKRRFEVVIQDFPDRAEGYYQLARWIEKQSPDVSLTYLEKAVELDPKNFVYADSLAHQYIRLSRFSDAEALYKKFLDYPQFKKKVQAIIDQLQSNRIEAN